MAWNVAVTPRSFGSISDKAFRILADAGCSVKRICTDHPLSAVELIEVLGEIDGLITGLDEVTFEVFDACPGLKVVSKYGIGVDNIDLDAARDRQVTVCNTPGVNSDAVADLAMGLILSIARRISEADREVKGGKWGKYIGSAVHDKVLGIIGTGSIGSGVAKRSTGFNMEVLAYDISINQDLIANDLVTYVELDDLISRSDYISLHLPLNEKTKHIIGARELSLMKNSAYLINTARPGLVDNAALYQALIDEVIAGAAIDAHERELSGELKLVSLANLVITPHVGAYTREAVDAMAIRSAANLICALSGDLDNVFSVVIGPGDVGVVSKLVI